MRAGSEKVMPGQAGTEQLGIMAASQLQGSRFDPELGLHMFYLCSYGFAPGSPVSSQLLKTCQLVNWRL